LIDPHYFTLATNLPLVIGQVYLNKKMVTHVKGSVGGQIYPHLTNVVDEGLLKILFPFKAHLQNYIQPWTTPAIFHNRILFLRGTVIFFNALRYALCAKRGNVLKILSDWTLPHSEPAVNEKFVDAGLHGL
jgi:hypothetical protein